jgi:hypothetical protein
MKIAIMHAAVTARRRAANSALCGGEIADKTDSGTALPYTVAALEPTMSQPASLIMLQFLAWIAERPRTREQAVEAWHSCPHISVWEDAVVERLVRTENDGRRTIALTSRGRTLLEERPRELSDCRIS